ncbi:MULTISPECIES: serine hydrolase domain-containing protein [Pseudoalteromonas]|uniref:Serine hydrolase domain-containing protein n=1 Tax=Pseudoalteromonas obscura TaxID=3048491 RepID=A0ABT7EKB4_9GAMM|nr:MULTISPECIES: serine hydrolase domain-containing protein [Pseudoalteromonas]MBQ4837308.1 beta-lactamase family protein [Pseudoalteromonas luteoviolacea]MDK2595469.1 serine hydrolase domain-containing protein [Pseudoalteromonas sp. P94(2023)]
MIHSVVDELGRTSPLAHRLVPWWSFTKTVLATLTMRLCDNDKLNLDSKLPKRPFTYRQLLQHTSGLNDYSFLPEYHQAVANSKPSWPVDTLMNKVKVDELRFEPGRGWCYSNLGYLLLRMEIERIYDMALPDITTAFLVKELNLKSAFLVEDLAAFNMLQVGPKGYDPNWCYHGLLAGNIEDAALFLHYLMRGELVSQNALNEMQTLYKLNVDVGERPWTTPAAGLGLMCNRDANLDTVGHTGMGPGSVIAVHHFKLQKPKTVAVFKQCQDQSVVENKAVILARAGS